VAVDFDERVRTLASAEIEGKDWVCYYLSWATEDEWLGGAYVLAYGPVTARLRAQAMGIAPCGGECLICRLPDGHPVPSDEYRNRLLTRSDLLEIDPEAKSLRELRKETPPC
jgi:hypothetical protein